MEATDEAVDAIDSDEDAGGDAAPEAADDSPLLAVPPGSRNAPRVHQGPNSKGKKLYFPKKTDSRPAGA